MSDLRFYVLFNNILVISGRWAGNNSEFKKLMFAKMRFVITKPLSAPSLVLSVHA